MVGGRGLTGLLYDQDGKRKPIMKSPKHFAAFLLVLPARIAVEAVILPIRIIQFIDNLGPLGGHKS